MLRLTRYIARTLSVRLSLTVVFAIATLLTAALFIMLQFSRKAVKEEALRKAEQSLETTSQRIDNILLCVEQTAGNIYWNMSSHLDDADKMHVYCRKLVETNPYITGCAIAFEPYFYEERGKYFMAYVYRSDSDSLVLSDSPIIRAETFGNRPYLEQVWYTKAIKLGRPCWIDPLKSQKTKSEAIITFSIPIHDSKGQTVGVLAVNVSLSLLSQIILGTKPSVNSYCTLLGRDGSFIVHPDSNKLLHQTVFTQIERGTNPTVKEAAEAMVSGQTGYKYFRLNDKDSYVFYKPFKASYVAGRSMENIGWSIGVIYPEDDIFGDYQLLLYITLGIVIIGLLLLLVLCQLIIHRQLLPLRILTQSAQRIAKGHFNEAIPNSRQKDEIGRLQDYFQQMQQSLATHVGELEQLTATLQEQGEVLRVANEQAQEADRIKTAFLHHMTNQIAVPVNNIDKSVENLCGNCRELPQDEVVNLVDNIQDQGKIVTSLLKHMLEASETEIKNDAP